MKRFFRRIKNKPSLTFITIFFILSVVSTICLTYSILRVANIENILRYMISALLIILLLFNGFETYKLIWKGKNFGIILFGTIFMLLFIGECYACNTINNIYNSIDNIYKNTVTYSTDLISLKEKNIDDIKKITSFKIGMINDETSIDGYQISKEIIDEYNLEKSNEIIYYESLSNVISALYKKEIDAAFVTSTYISMFANIEDYSDISSATKTIYSKSKTVEKNKENNNLTAEDPFTVLVVGIDSTFNDISKVTSFNADSLMLITFNPKTSNATILSIPRDTYVPIACTKNKVKSKITHSGWYNTSCVVQTIEEWMDIDINYYIKINFAGLVNLVDAVDGIEVDVPYSFCEQNSNRLWGVNTIYVKKGLQTLNGEQALALARNRHPNPGMCSYEWTNYDSNDLVRGQNQQKIINAIINKAVKNLNLNKIYSILDIISSNIDTNVNTNDILSYYNLAKDMALNSNDDVVTFERLYLSTYGKYIYDGLMNMPLSDQIYYEESYNAVVNRMLENLGKKEVTLIKTFTFSANKTYTSTIIGKDNYTQEDIETVPNFKSKDKSVALSWAQANNIAVTVEYKKVSEGTDDFVLSQSIPASYLMDKVDKTKGLTITVAKVVQSTDSNTNDNTDDNTSYPTE